MQERIPLTSSSNGQRALNGAELLVGDERGVSVETNVDLAVLHEAADVLETSLISK